ncbi:hypothetical protein H1R20_g4923, partial [Candolleomyces eurysporus]
MVVSPIAYAGEVKRAKKQGACSHCDSVREFPDNFTVGFYFADSNFPYDKLRWTLYSKDPEHWIPISTIVSFKRMREYASHSSEWLVSALRSSTFLEVNSIANKVCRTNEVKEPKDAIKRSVYAKGFLEDEDATLQQRLEVFFNMYGVINSARMRRDENKKFKASVFTEFADFETVDKSLKAEPKPTFKGKELLIMSKADYCDMKIKEKGLTGKATVHRREAIAKGRGFDAFKEMKSGADKPKQHNKAILEYIGNRITIRRDHEGNGSVDPEDVPFVRGATLQFDGCGGDCTWSDIKDPLKEKFNGRPPYIKYSYGDDFGLVGFHRALTEEEISSVKELVKKVTEKEVTWCLPLEDNEKAFQIERAQVTAKSAFIQLDKTTGKGSHGAGRGGRGGRGGRSGRGGGGRGGGGCRGGGRGGGHDSKPAAAAEGAEKTNAEAGEKRKRGVEPDGGPYAGTRGTNAPPALTRSESATKKQKVDGESS